MRSIRFGLAVPVIGVMLLAGCGHPPSSPSTAYLNRGGPESLIDVSSEVVNLRAATAKDVRELGTWIAKDAPSRAQLNCATDSKSCKDARKLLTARGVTVTDGLTGDDSVTLVYERVVVRDCEQRYVDNRDNFYNLNHPSFGCAVASNMVRQVTNKEEFINPDLSDSPSAVRAVNDYRRAHTPRPVVAPYDINESLTSSAKSQ